MGVRFRKSIKIAPGVKLNIGKKSTGISIGGKTGGVSFNSKTGARARISAPGTGLSYSTKIGGSKTTSKKHTTHEKYGDTICIKQPIPRRKWFVVLSVLFIFSGIIYCPTKISTGIITLAIGALMMFFTFRTPKTPIIDMTTFNRYLQIFDESIQIFMDTKNPETFFGRYQDAENAALAMAEMTDAPLVHNESPQSAIEMLENDKTSATNSFLDRYAAEIRMKAFELTRGRKAKIESFKLISSEFEDKMTQDSIRYRDSLYIDMLKKIEE